MHERTELPTTIKLREFFLPKGHRPHDRRMYGPILAKVRIPAGAEYGPILAKVRIPAGAEFRSFLSDNDAPGIHDFSPEEFYATALRAAIANIRG